MSKPEDVEYTVVLVSPIFGSERENAEQVIESALEYLNTFREEPGFRFAPYVTARLDMVLDVEQAQIKLDTDDSIAMMIMHDLFDEERDALSHECASRDVPVCHTTPAPDRPRRRPRPARDKKRGWQIVFRKRDENDHAPRAHRILETTLIASLEGEEEEMMERVGQLIAVMALGVMEHHWKKNPPQYHFLPE